MKRQHHRPLPKPWRKDVAPVKRRRFRRFLIALACAVLGLIGFIGKRSNSVRLSFGTPKATVPSLAQALLLSAEQLRTLDLVTANLLCAQGLNGAEQLDVQQCLVTLDTWARHVNVETTRNFHQFREHPEEFRNSEGYFRMLMLITVLQQDFGVRYNPARITPLDQPEPDSAFVADSQDLFLHGILGPRRMGTCVSMPVLYVAVGRRLGYPLKLVTAKGHLFARWDGDERFNIEGTNHGLNCFEDEYYRTWPYPLTAAEVKSGHYLKSLTAEEELGLFLATRGQCLFHHGRLAEAREAFAKAAELAPHWPEHTALLAQVSQGMNASPPTHAGTVYLSQQARAEIDAHVERVEAVNRENRARMEAQFRQLQSPPVPAPPFQPTTPR